MGELPQRSVSRLSPIYSAPPERCRRLPSLARLLNFSESAPSPPPTPLDCVANHLRCDGPPGFQAGPRNGRAQPSVSRISRVSSIPGVVPTVLSIPGVVPTVTRIPRVVPTVLGVPGVMPTVLRIPGILVVGTAVSPTVSSLLGHQLVGTIFADKVLPSLFDNVVQGRIGRFEAYRCVRLDTRVSVPDAQHRSRSEPDTKNLQAIQKGAPREPFVVQLPLYFLSLMQSLPVAHSCLPGSNLTKTWEARMGPSQNNTAVTWKYQAPPVTYRHSSGPSCKFHCTHASPPATSDALEPTLHLLPANSIRNQRL